MIGTQTPEGAFKVTFPTSFIILGSLTVVGGESWLKPGENSQLGEFGNGAVWVPRGKELHCHPEHL